MCLVFFKWLILGLFFVYFRLFKQTLQFEQQIYVNFLCRFSIQRRDWNPQPKGTRESSHNHYARAPAQYVCLFASE